MIAAPLIARLRTCAALLTTLFGTLPAQGFTYHQVTASHQRAFGLAMQDLDADGDLDIVAGRFVYLNPGGGMTGAWTQIRLPVGDAMLATDVDGDAFADVIANNTPNIEWLEATDLAATQWTQRAVIGQVPANSGFHRTGQGYALAQIVPGGRPELAFSGDTTHVYSFEIPAQNPELGNWPRTDITTSATEEGIAFVDIDRDGFVDLLATDMYSGLDRVAWFRNPGDGSGNWSMFRIGTTTSWADRIAGADLNGDGRRDIVVSEENSGSQPNAKVYWYEQPADPTTPAWPRHVLATQYTTNSLDVVDIDGDGDADVVTGEHKGTEELALWLNDGSGTFTKQLVDSGKESHLGARVADLDRDGDFDIVSIAYDAYQIVHVWRNDSTGVPARETVRAGSPANPTALRGGVTHGPVLGQTWDPVVDHTTFARNATADFLLLALRPANVPTPFGTLLCADIVGALTTASPGAAFALPVPFDPYLVGATLTVQALSLDAANTPAATNALDIRIGTR